ncbi:hypothetical protein [Rhizobium sp. YTU87027]|uniref:hypothetical protein n=1 Tax=Rhizobium sp. YTU87027 TaxID=3417741 RepID=UPI003D6921D5
MKLDDVGAISERLEDLSPLLVGESEAVATTIDASQDVGEELSLPRVQIGAAQRDLDILSEITGGFH